MPHPMSTPTRYGTLSVMVMVVPIVQPSPGVDVGHQTDAATRREFLIAQLLHLGDGGAVHHIGEDLGLIVYFPLNLDHNFLAIFYGAWPVKSSIQQGSVALHQFPDGERSVSSLALHRLGGQIPVRAISAAAWEVLFPQSCQQLRRQLLPPPAERAVQGVLPSGSRKTDIQIQFALTPVPDGHIDRAGAVAV